MKALKIIAIAALGLTTLTACDPPIPQSILISQAEQSFVSCETGNLVVGFEDGFSDLGLSWQQFLSGACTDMTFDTVGVSDEADLYVSSGAAKCEAFARVPVAFDAAAVVFYLDDAFALNLSGATIAGIFSGEITSWDDPRIIADNPDLPPVAVPINVVAEAPSSAIAAMEAWTTQISGAETAFSLLTPADDILFQDTIFAMQNGDVALMPLSAAQVTGSSYAQVIVGNDPLTDVVLADPLTAYAAATQFRLIDGPDEINIALDFDASPMPQPGQNEADAPYQGLYPLMLDVCGEDTLLKRALARYFLRLDAQGLIATSTVFALQGDVRIESATVVGEGLPLPEITFTPEG